MNIEVTAGTVTETSTGVEGALDVDVTVTIDLTEQVREALQAAGYDSHVSGTQGRVIVPVSDPDCDGPEGALVDIRALLAPLGLDGDYNGDSNTDADGDTTSDIAINCTREFDGGVTLVLCEQNGWRAYGDSPDTWIDGRLLGELRSLYDGNEFRDVLSAIQAEASEACDGYEPEAVAS